MSIDIKIPGIHHITAVASAAAENLSFYRNILGLRLVKQTVNFDDPYTYHLYYGDGRGGPGSILTFFPWENLPKGRPGAGMVTAITFAVPPGSIEFWEHRITATGARIKTAERFGEPVIQLSDPHGLPIELIGTFERPSTLFWDTGPIDRANAIAGFHSATTSLHDFKPIDALLREVMGMTLYDQDQNRYRYKMGDSGAPGHFYDVVIDPQAPQGRPGGGTVHHIAFRTASDAGQRRWQSVLRSSGLIVTEVRDRKYFRSIYFHSPGGVLFEIATDPPGFGVDETPADLGSALKLPSQFERLRSEIEAGLPALHRPRLQHAYEKPSGGADADQTLITLHGTGGSERDLLGLERQVNRSAAIVSPRGQVLENGRPRFFKRLAYNIFDEQDVVYRAHELADFLVESARRYNLNPNGVTALGYSNGANIAAAVILLRPEIFSRAVLLRPMMPLQNPAFLADLSGKKILVLRGTKDEIIPYYGTENLIAALKTCGADVTVVHIDAGHEITANDVNAIARWLSGQEACEPENCDEAVPA